MSDPALQGPEGVVARQKLLDNGYKPEEVDQWQQAAQKQQFDNGWKPEDIDAYWGNAPKDMSSVKATVEQSFSNLSEGDKQRLAETPWDSFRAGLQTSAVEIPFGKPTILPPQHADMASDILYRFGQTAGDLPATVLGWMGGKAVGTLAGAVAGAPAGPEGAAGGAAVGGLIGAGAGSAALPEIWRREWMDHQAMADGYKTWGQFWAHTAEIIRDTGKSALIGAVSAPLGGLAGHAVAGAMGEGIGAAVASRAADNLAMAGAATATGAALEGHIPTAQDVTTAAVLTLGFHGAGEFYGATQRFVASQRAQVVQANLRDAYVATGRNPMTLAQEASRDVAVQGEVLGPTAADGTRLTPALDSMKLPEPEPWSKPDTPTEPEVPVKEPETSASEGVKNENGLTHEDQAILEKYHAGYAKQMPGDGMTTDEVTQHFENLGNNPAYLATHTKMQAAANQHFETVDSPTLSLQGNTDEWVPEPAPRINEPDLIEPLPAQPTDAQKAMFHKDPVEGKNVAWSESQKQWVEPHDMTKGDWEHLQALVEPKIGQAEKEPFSWWHGSSVQDPHFDPAKASHKISAIWVASSRAIAAGFANGGSHPTGGTISRVRIAAGKYFDFRDPAHQQDFIQWMKNEKLSQNFIDQQMDTTTRGHYVGMEKPLVQRFLRENGYEGYFEREVENTPVNLAVFDKNKIRPDESGPSPVKKQMLRLKAEQAEAEGYTEPGTMLSVYGAGERMTPEEEAAARKDIVAGNSGGPPKPPGGTVGPRTDGEEPKEPPTWQEAGQQMRDLIAPDIKKGILPDWANPRRWLSGFQSQLTPARTVDMMIGSDAKQMGVEDNARQTYASSGRINEFFTLGGLRITDPKKWTLARVNSSSLKAAYQAVKEDGGNVLDFTTGRIALRTLEKAQQGVEIHPVLTPELALARLSEPGFKEKYGRGLKIMQEHTDNVVNYGQDAHLFSPALAEAMKSANRVYINLRRVVDPDYVPGTGGGGSNVFNPVRKLVGGDRMFGNVVVNDFENAASIISMADKNLAHLNIIDHVMANRGDPNLKALGFDISQIEAKDLDRDVLLQAHMVDDDGVPLTESEKDGVLPFLAQRVFNKTASAKKGNYLVFRDGKPEVYHTDNPDLQAVLGMEAHGTPHAIFQLAIKMAGLERAGIIGSPGFMLRSLVHQNMASAVTGHGSGPVPFLNMWRGLMPEMFGGVGKEAWQEAQAQGIGGESAMSVLDRDPLLKNVTDVFDKGGTWSSVMNMARHPIDAWRSLSARLHQASSVAGYERLKAQGYDPGKAAMITRTDYLDHGEPLAASFANTWARMTPFMSTGIKDIEQLGRALQDRPVSTIMNGLVKLTLPTLALSYVNSEMDKTLPPGSRYADLPEWRKDLFWNIPVAGVHIAIPKPYAVGAVFATMPELLMRHFESQAPVDFRHVGAVLAQQMLPPGIPTIAHPAIDQATNSRFDAGNLFTKSVPLVPASLAGVTNWMQYKADTSMVARKITQVLGPANMNVANLSPIVLDHYIQSWGGTLAMQFMRAVGAPYADPGPPKTWADNPLFGSFIARNPGAHSQVVEDLYDKMNEFEVAHASEKLAEKRMNPDEIAAGHVPEAFAKISVVRSSLKRQMAAINAVNASKDLTDEEKTKRGDQLSQYLVKSAERSLDYLNKWAK